jgi:transposase
MTAPIRQTLADKALAPATHLTDAGYVDAELLVASQAEHSSELLGPPRPDVSWQAKESQGFDISAFAIDWEARIVTCPQGQTSVDWALTCDNWSNDTVHIGFHRRTCAACASRCGSEH